ncbi:hypothetical protein ACFQH6_13670 [Halobacteriaceae archaeon GCM10025711]
MLSMVKESERSSRRINRRTVLKTVGLAVAGSTFSASAAGQEGDSQFSLTQGDRCIPLTPLQGSQPVEELYDYRYPMDRFDGPPGSQGFTYSSHGTTSLQRPDTSIMFLYEGPNGLSLVVVHGALADGSTAGAVTFRLSGMPSSGSWLVKDDYYTQNGQQVESNHDVWNVGGSSHTIDWTWAEGRTDGARSAASAAT